MNIGSRVVDLATKVAPHPRGRGLTPTSWVSGSWIFCNHSIYLSGVCKVLQNIVGFVTTSKQKFFNYLLDMFTVIYFFYMIKHANQLIKSFNEGDLSSPRQSLNCFIFFYFFYLIHLGYTHIFFILQIIDGTKAYTLGPALKLSAQL